MLLGSATVDDHGGLTYPVLLPMNLPDGAYEVRGTGTHHVVGTPHTIVPDSSGDEEGGQRGEDEPLLAPMPTQGAGTEHPNAATSANTTASLPTTETDP